MACDKVSNFGKCVVSTGYDAAAVTIVLSSGQGSKLPSVFSFNLVWWNATDYPDSCDDPNVEIVRVTNRVNDTLTVTRGADGTSAKTHNTAGKTYQMILAMGKQLVEQITGKCDGLFKSAFDATRTADQAVAGGASGLLSKVEFNVENFDKNAEFDPTMNFRFTAKTAGLYLVSFSFRISVLTDGLIYEGHVRKNAASFITSDRQTVKGTDTTLKNSRLVELAVNDYLQVCVWNPAATGITLNASATWAAETYFCAHNVYDGT